MNDQVALDPGDRVLILAPHPDDETIATGGIIQKAVAMGLPVHVAYLTCGDNNEWSFVVYRKRPVIRSKSIQAMGVVRQGEGLAATGILGLGPHQVTFLGYPDFRTLQIWCAHWGDSPPCSSMFTRVSAVPYAAALRPGAPHRGDDILQDLKTVLRDFKPTKIFVSHPGDHNPDHQSLYLFARVALWDLSVEDPRQWAEPQPVLHTFLVHHPNWPEPEGYHPDETLPPPARLMDQVSWLASPLTPEEIARKATALHAHKSQYEVSSAYLDSFMRANELFGDFPTIILQSGMPGVFETAQAGGSGGQKDASPELTHEEQAKFVGLERREIRLDGDELVLTIGFSKRVSGDVLASAYVFGYRFDRPFSGMPKLRVELGELRHAVYDQDRKLHRPPVAVTRNPQEVVMRFPLAGLGYPQWILGSARTYMGKVPLDWIAWRLIELPERTGSKN
jgi:LmbE family N-acetylglucosaminyl deacetylase